MSIITPVIMDNKQMYAIIAVAVVVVAGAAAALVLTKDKNKDDSDSDPYVGLALTNDLFDGHTCCIIGAREAYLEDNPDTVMAFLDGYVEAVNLINSALSDKSSDAYKDLISVAMNRVAMPDSLSDSEKKAAIQNALGNVTYLYADNDNGNLSDLVNDISALAESLYNANQINKSATDLGFSNYNQLASNFVDDSYMKDAISDHYTKPSSKTTVKIAAIEGDIHQIAIWYAKDMGIFDKYNIDIAVIGQGGGPGVYTTLQGKDADIGFLGAPPMTIRCMNNEDIKASGATMQIIGRVNSEGSGILLKPGEKASDYITVSDTEPAAGAKYIKNPTTGKYYVFNADTWGGKIFATPGAATIQHVQLSQLADLMGLKFQSYTSGMSTSSDTLYYVAGVSSFAALQNMRLVSPEIVGYIIWEAQYSIGLQ